MQQRYRESLPTIPRVDADVFPPQVFAARAVEFAVMATAERDGELWHLDKNLSL
jgi:hypothetical protein